MPEGSSRVWPGVAVFATAVMTAASVAVVAATSVLPGFNPPDWLRIATMAPMPLLLLAAIGFGVAGVVRRQGRALAAVALAVAGLSPAGFVVLIATAGRRDG